MGKGIQIYWAIILTVTQNDVTKHGPINEALRKHKESCEHCLTVSGKLQRGGDVWAGPQMSYLKWHQAGKQGTSQSDWVSQSHTCDKHTPKQRENKFPGRHISGLRVQATTRLGGRTYKDATRHKVGTKKIPFHMLFREICYYLTHVRMAIIQRRRDNKCWGVVWGKGNPCALLVRTEIGTTTVENGMVSSKI